VKWKEEKLEKKSEIDRINYPVASVKQVAVAPEVVGVQNN
jgi:hypothetical protein